MITRRLVLRPWEPDDAEALFRHASQPDVGPRAGWPPHTDVEESQRIISDVLMAPEEYAITLGGTPIGSVGLHLPGPPELGYWVAAHYWGQGIATEAAQAVLDRAFNVCGISEVSATAAVDNVASQRVLDKLGFRYLHTADHYLKPLGVARLSRFYTLKR